MDMQMGQWYEIEAQAVKIHRTDYYDWYNETLTAYAESLPYDAMWDRRPFKELQHAMYIGNREVYCGDWVEDTYWDSDLNMRMPAGVNRFERRYQHRVYVFVLTERQNPIYVFPNDVIEPKAEA